MKYLELSDLLNKNNFSGQVHTRTSSYCLGKNQAYQVTAGRVEIWEKLNDGRLMLVKRWNKKNLLNVI